MMRSALIVSLLCASCRPLEVAAGQLNDTTMAETTTTSQPKEVVDICGTCNCTMKQIRCNNKPKTSSLLNIRIPPNFNVLDLSSNRLRAITQDSFYNAPDITELNLAYNQIGYIAERSFENFTNLTSLCLTHNTLATLEDDSFLGLEKLEKLDISENRFRRLNPEYLARLINLKYLILDRNSLEGLHGSCFRNNTKLTQLFLNKIGLTFLDTDLFHYTRDLRVLHIEDNYLEEIPKLALSKLPLLEFLSLSGNPIHVISAMAFPRLPNLQQIVLTSMSHLQMIEVYAFMDLPMLRFIKIQHCSNLVSIDPLAFNLDIQGTSKPKYPPIKHFVLHDTSVPILSEKLLDWANVDDLDISENPFHCNCNMSWIVDFVKKHDVNEDIRCQTPKELQDHVIGRLVKADMKCDEFDPIKDSDEDLEVYQRAAKSKGDTISMLHFGMFFLLAAAITLSILMLVSLKRRGYLYKKLGKPTPMVHVGGDNVLYLRTTIDNY